MDALILRMALLLRVAPSAAAAMQATDVLALAHAHAAAEDRRGVVRDLTALRNCQWINLAVFAPEKLATEDQRIRDAAGLTPAPTPLPPALEAQLAALPLEG